MARREPSEPKREPSEPKSAALLVRPKCRPTTTYLVSPRTALLLLLALLAGAAATALTVAGRAGWPAAILTGTGAAGAALALFDRVIGPPDRR